MCDFVLMGQKIFSERKLQNISQKDLAAAVGVAPSTIQRYESGTFKKAKMPVVESIANHLHINPSWLLGKSNTKELNMSLSQNKQSVEDYSMITELFNQLDIEDRAEIKGEIKQMLKAEKYTKSNINIAAKETPMHPERKKRTKTT